MLTGGPFSQFEILHSKFATRSPAPQFTPPPQRNFLLPPRISPPSRGLEHEADISTEQPPPQAHAWIPRSHADEGRSGSSLAPAAQRPQAPRRLGAGSRWNSEQTPAVRRRCRNRSDWQNAVKFF